MVWEVAAQMQSGCETQAMEAYKLLSLSKENADIINPEIPTMTVISISTLYNLQ